MKHKFMYDNTNNNNSEIDINYIKGLLKNSFKIKLLLQTCLASLTLYPGEQDSKLIYKLYAKLM